MSNKLRVKFNNLPSHERHALLTLGGIVAAILLGAAGIGVGSWLARLS